MLFVNCMRSGQEFFQRVFLCRYLAVLYLLNCLVLMGTGAQAQAPWNVADVASTSFLGFWWTSVLTWYSWYGNTFSGGGLGPGGLTLNHTWHISQIAWLLLEHWSRGQAPMVISSLVIAWSESLVKKKQVALYRICEYLRILPKVIFHGRFWENCYNLPGGIFSTSTGVFSYLISRVVCPVSQWGVGLYQGFFLGNFWFFGSGVGKLQGCMPSLSKYDLTLMRCHEGQQNNSEWP